MPELSEPSATAAIETGQVQPATSRFPKMLTLEDVQDFLNIGMSAVRAMVTSGELRGVQLGGRRMWRVSEEDLSDYLQRAYSATQNRIAAGEFAPSPGSDEP